MSLKIIKTSDLHFQDNYSDKVYHAALLKKGDDGFIVEFAYGRRGNPLTYGLKTAAGLAYEKAEKVFDKLVAEKTGKGYTPKPGISGRVFAGDIAESPLATESATELKNPKAPKEKVGFLPQLLNPIDEADLPAFFADNLWGMQEKKDGKRCMAVCSGEPAYEAYGVNRKGQKFHLPPDTISFLREIIRPAILDCELVGDTLHTFGLLEYKGQNLRPQPYVKSYSILENIILENDRLNRPESKLKLVPLYQTKTAKMEIYEQLKRDNKEGVVLKKLNAPYCEGRPNSGGDCLKFKFYATASVLILDVNTGKRSVQMGVVSANAETVPVGNVTIPPNHKIPDKGDIAEVRYLYAFPGGGSLFQPIFLGKRDDLETLDCSITQLKYVNREELPELNNSQPGPGR